MIQIPEEDRLAVKEVTLDLSSSMKDIVSTVFPNATIVLDCFHVLKRCHDAVEEMRLRTKREAQVDVRRQARKFKERQKHNAAHRKWYRKTHPKNYSGKVRGPKPKIKSREDEVLNYFINRSTNAGAESLNSKMKSFRAQLRGVSDPPFFMFRLSKIFG